MPLPNKPGSLAILVWLAVATPVAAWGDCASLKSAFDNAVAAKAGPTIIGTVNDIADDSSCDFDLGAYRRSALDALIDAAEAASSPAERQADLDWINRNLDINGSWRNADKLGAYYDKIGDRRNASLAYQEAIELAKRKPQGKPTDKEFAGLAQRVAASFRVANDDDEGRKKAKYVRAVQNADGSVGGVYALLRAVNVGRLPLPINFVFGTADITPAGQSAVKELAQALAEQNIHSLRLIGHADPRGLADFNLVLSRQRAAAAAAAVTAELRQSHPELTPPTILTDGKGASEPFDPSVLNYAPTQEEIWALDRRVEYELVTP